MKTLNDIIAEAEQAFPRIEGQTITDTYRMMENRQRYMRETYGDMPTLNDED